MTDTHTLGKMLVILLVVLFVATGIASADTVKFKDGSAMDGIVTEPNQDTILLQVGKAKMTFPKVDVESIEKNDKKGDDPKTVDAFAKRHNDSIEERTGLNRDQRDAVRGLFPKLRSEDEVERKAARQKLVEMGKSVRVFDYIESALPSMPGTTVPELMQTLVEMDPARAEATVVAGTVNGDPRNRGKAIELMATYKKPENLGTIARGIVDYNPQVRISAVKALVATGDKAGTPALIKGLSDPDPKVQNASRDALQALWSETGKVVTFEKPEEWTSFWSSKSSGVKNAVDASKLVPLVSEEDAAAGAAVCE